MINSTYTTRSIAIRYIIVIMIYIILLAKQQNVELYKLSVIMLFCDQIYFYFINDDDNVCAYCRQI